jgi:ribosomal protein S18 acetylase RimI-like enzyme
VPTPTETAEGQGGAIMSTKTDSDPAKVKGAPDDLTLRFVREWSEFPKHLPPDRVAAFLHRALVPFEDKPEDIDRGISDALSPEPPRRGFVLLALDGDRLVGALVMLKTGMKGYIPENLLLFVAVDPACRGRGIGGRLCLAATQDVDGGVKLHVEYDNPAKRLYERLGFENKYAEMRLPE